MSRVFKVPFAVTGDRENVPTDTQPDGKVSYEQGFGYDYQRPYDDPDAKDISRESFNGLLFDVTDAIGEMQIQGAATWSQEGAPYPINALVRHDGKLWQSKVENNNAQPAEGSNWTEVVIGDLAKSADLPIAGTGLEQVGKDFRVRYGTSAGTAVQGNVRVNGKALSGTVTITKADVGLGNVTNDTQAKAQTQIIAGTGLEGGGSLAANRTLSVKYGTTAGTAAQGNDSRIVNALQKGNNLSDVTNPATARSNLGLKGAATRDVVSSPTDTSGGNKVVTQGWMGLGDPVKVSLNDGDDLNNLTVANRFFSWVGKDILNNPTGHPWGAGLTFGWMNGEGLTQIVWGSGGQKWYLRQRSNANEAWSPWREILHTGNILKSTGDNNEFPMSQKAVTDALATKANVSNPGSMGIGVGQTWQDVTGSRAIDVTYTNTTGRTIIVTVAGRSVSAGKDSSIRMWVDRLTVDFCQVTGASPGTGLYPNVSAAVPPGSSYRVGTGSFDAIIFTWSELR